MMYASYQPQTQLTNNQPKTIIYDNDNESYRLCFPSYPLDTVKQEDFALEAIPYTEEQDLLLTSGYSSGSFSTNSCDLSYLTPPIASPSSHYSNESYYSPVEQTANFDFFPVVHQQPNTMYNDPTMFDCWPSSTQSSPMYCTDIQNPIPNSSSPTSLRSTTSSASSLSSSVEEQQPPSHQQQTKQTTESRPYACPTCRRAFARKHDLQRHIRVHTGEKPYTCPCCKKAFARTDALKRHLRMEEQCRTSHQVQAMRDTGRRRYKNL